MGKKCRRAGENVSHRGRGKYKALADYGRTLTSSLILCQMIRCE